MRTIKSARTMQRLALSWREAGVPVALVPTMGFLHAGHLSLMKRARRLIGPDGKVVVSLFVNPTQFGPGEDFETYPRDPARDRQLCKAEGVDALFAPTVSDMYPPGDSTVVEENALTQTLEGTSRPEHFSGVTTVVNKLFNIALPKVAVFGEKDFQQLAVIRKMVADLAMPVRVVGSPTVREKDGVAMSSRNRYLSGKDRERATVLWMVISEARTILRKGAVSAAVLKKRLFRLADRVGGVKVDYIELVDPKTLKTVRKVERGARLVMAVRIGKVRLIDNATV